MDLSDANPPLQPRPYGEAAWFGLLYAHHHLVEQVDGALKAEHDLPLSTFEVLLRLAAHDHCGGFVSISQLAATVLRSSSRVSRLLEGLEQRGHIQRRPSERDARVSEVALTQRGRALYTAADVTHRRVVNDLFLAHLSDQEVEVLARVWCKLPGHFATELTTSEGTQSSGNTAL